MYVISSPTSRSDLRKSMDSDKPPSIPIIDEAAMKQSQKRARKVQELVRTEEGYVADLKALHHAYCTLLMPNQRAERTAAQACLGDMMQLHEQILAELQGLLPQLLPCEVQKFPTRPSGRPRLFTTGGRLDALSPTRVRYNDRWQRKSMELSRPSLSDATEHLCTPHLAAEVAQVFVSNAKRLVVYEEYGARCGKMQFEVDLQLSRSPNLDHDRALEALQATIHPLQGRAQRIKRALGLKDLLIKPIQRITRYELLFKDLCSLTPCGDDPVSHSTIDDALFLISQTCHDLNEASGNLEKLRALDSHRSLQQRLLFEKKAGLNRDDVPSIRQTLTLWIIGQYAIAILYESCMVIAAATSSTRYHVLLVIPLSTSAIEEPDNGKALQCHTTPHTWKMTFENDGALFEVLSVACSKAEADVWRGQVSGRIAVEKQHLNEGRSTTIEIRSPLTDEMRGVGKAYGRSCDFRRRASVQRAATLGPLTELNQVIIKNTQAACKETDSQTLSLPIPRSQSVITPSHIPVLAPRRSDRIHLEAVLMDVWTKDVLPFPGLGSKRGEYSMRASAGHVIRKLSMASITSNFSKRSMSYTSISQASSIDDRSFRYRPRGSMPDRHDKKPAEKKIDFHSAPEAFLPEDFDLKNTTRARGRLAGLRTLTMGMERPRTPFVSVENQSPGTEPKRSRSIITRRRSGGMDTAQMATAGTSVLPIAPILTTQSVQSNARQTTGSTQFQEGRLGVRQRARSRLAKLLA
ncbi:Hypothetical protein D9617_7g032190 [Elsinoe fawcettii]|nr:Hypothetical protein D9617_7g032190 [Elsinoe fawcettii]